MILARIGNKKVIPDIANVLFLARTHRKLNDTAISSHQISLWCKMFRSALLHSRTIQSDKNFKKCGLTRSIELAFMKTRPVKPCRT
jgi:hypothetical protein